MTMPRAKPADIEAYTRAGWWRNRLLDSYLDEAARRHPTRVAVVDRGRRLTYETLDRLARRVAAGLAGHGVRAGDVVSFQLPNWAEAVVAYFGILKAGAVGNPVIPIYRQRELRFILRQARAGVAIVPATFRGVDHARMLRDLAPALPDLRHIFVVGPPEHGLHAFDELLDARWEEPRHVAALDRLSRSPDDPAMLLYTSGTTADPKGAVHSHNTLEYKARSIIELCHLTADDRVFMPSPVTHITGLLFGLQLPAMLETMVVLQDVWEPRQALALIEAERCRFVIGATPFLHGLVHHPDLHRYDVGSLRTFLCGGADVPPELIRAATDRLGCCAARAYGLTECPAITASGPDDPLARRAGTDGRVLHGASARIIDDAGREAAPGQLGEILVRGPETFLGYLDSELDATGFDADGWFHTGDLGVLESDGALEVRGRRKDIIVRGGENISAKEVEDLLHEHPKIREVAIVAMSDPVMVERACAFVVAREGEAPSLEELNAFLRSRQLAVQKLPERLEVVAALPKTASGKVQKFRLRETIEAELARTRAAMAGGPG
jgi:cyclohexanecarboxylate-CoA ligase